MRLLLDTHAFLWFLAGNEALSHPARSAIENSANEIFVSHASAWEVAIKLSLNRLTLQVPYDQLFTTTLESNGFHMLPSHLEHYRALIGLPWHHRDPFDRLLVAQAQVDALTLVSRDAHFPTYGVSVIW